MFLSCSPDDDVLAARVLSHSQASTSKAAAAGLGRSGSMPAPSKQQQAPAPPDPMLVTARLGAEAAFKAVAVRFGAALFELLPSLWLHMAAALEGAPGADGAPGGDPQGLINAVQVRVKANTM